MYNTGNLVSLANNFYEDLKNHGVVVKWLTNAKEHVEDNSEDDNMTLAMATQFSINGEMINEYRSSSVGKTDINLSHLLQNVRVAMKGDVLSTDR